MNRTGIEYLDYTWNPTHGCSPASTGCKFCWAEKMSHRLAGMGVSGYSKEEPFKVVCCPDKLNEPSSIKKPSRIGVSFMGDLFHEDVPDSFIDDVWDTMLINNQHTYQILTKRPERMKNWIEKNIYDQAYWKNVWLGVSCENQEQADKRIPILLQIPAAVRFISVEPMLSPVSLVDIPYNSLGALHKMNVLNGYGGWGTYNRMEYQLHWVICGAESGYGARPMNPEWARDLRDQCKNADVPFFMKQMSKKAPIPKDLLIREYPRIKEL